MSEKVKSGKEVLDDFFANIGSIENVDPSVASAIADLYYQGKLNTDTHIKQTLQKLREHEDGENKKD